MTALVRRTVLEGLDWNICSAMGVFDPSSPVYSENQKRFPVCQDQNADFLNETHLNCDAINEQHNVHVNFDVQCSCPSSYELQGNL